MHHLLLVLKILRTRLKKLTRKSLRSKKSKLTSQLRFKLLRNLKLNNWSKHGLWLSCKTKVLITFYSNTLTLILMVTLKIIWINSSSSSTPLSCLKWSENSWWQHSQHRMLTFMKSESSPEDQAVPTTMKLLLRLKQAKQPNMLCRKFLRDLLLKKSSRVLIIQISRQKSWLWSFKYSKRSNNLLRTSLLLRLL